MKEERDPKRARTEEMVEAVNPNLMKLNTKEPLQTSQTDDDDTSQSLISFELSEASESLESPESPGSSESSGSYASPKRPKKKIQRGIKYKGGYGPPPSKMTDEEYDALYESQCNGIAAAGLELLNKRMASNGVHYELVMAHGNLHFRTKQGFIFHSNFLAKTSDDPNAEKRLFFVSCKYAPYDFDAEDSSDSDDDTPVKYEAIDCDDLGPFHTDSERCRNCETCKKMDVSCPNFHPLQSDVSHSCEFCDRYEPPAPIFHPPGFNVDHLRFD